MDGHQSAFIGCVYAGKACIPSRVPGLFDTKHCEFDFKKQICKINPTAVEPTPKPETVTTEPQVVPPPVNLEPTPKPETVITEPQGEPTTKPGTVLTKPQVVDPRQFQLPVNREKITKEDKAFKKILTELVNTHCGTIIVVISLHGCIDPAFPLIKAPEGLCITLTRTASTGCVALDYQVPLFKDISSQESHEILSPASRDAALERKSRKVFKEQKKLLAHVLRHPIILTPERMEQMKAMDAGLKKTRGRHCKAVTCAPSQLFYNKTYSRNASEKPLRSIIEVVNSGVTKGVDLLGLMIKYGFGRYKDGFESTTRDLVFKFFKALGVAHLIVFDASCSVIVKVSPDFDTERYEKETESVYALGGTR